MGTIPHARAMMVHAQRRFWQRFGLTLSIPEYRALCAAVASLDPVGHGSGGEPIYRVVARGRTVHAVWSPDEAAIVTFLRALTPAHRRRLRAARSQAA